MSQHQRETIPLLNGATDAENFMTCSQPVSSILYLSKYLIMGLNPPFGVNARLANQFIDKALTFKPKLLILIVPEETRRLDQKNPQYDLIWEDRESLSGKSFYLPGSIDICDKQIEQWNLETSSSVFMEPSGLDGEAQKHCFESRSHV
ncbi:hypothetical protein HPP92_004671 [Vanilla planifolia]|uniref:DM2 domain-containing protein n=1 Tax=Vanilla planifolia TaxID=51239 RepID=A0A835VBD4_VANPL|nr:hypothetical protein HPP92_004671 [Vanilla planifolia]